MSNEDALQTFMNRIHAAIAATPAIRKAVEDLELTGIKVNQIRVMADIEKGGTSVELQMDDALFLLQLGVIPDLKVSEL